MEAAEDRYDVAFDYEVDQVGEPANDRPSDVTMNLRIEARVAGDPTKKAVNGRDEVAAKTSLMRFVPLVGLKKIKFGQRSDNEAKTHLALPRRARTSGQGFPASG